MRAVFFLVVLCLLIAYSCQSQSLPVLLTTGDHWNAVLLFPSVRLVSLRRISVLPLLMLHQPLILLLLVPRVRLSFSPLIFPTYMRH